LNRLLSSQDIACFLFKEIVMTRITLTLRDDEKTALITLAAREFRDPRMQAALLIRRGLEQRGLIEASKPSVLQEPAADKNKSEKEN
jgi:hypothetical protein